LECCADEIARGLSPLDPPAGQLKAGRVLLSEVHGAIRNNETFALESTLSGFTYIRLLRQAREQGFDIELHHLWLATPVQAIARAREGGHDVPGPDIRRRFA